MSQKGFDQSPSSVHELQDFNQAEYQDQDVAKTKGGTSADLADMQRMGRTQELRVSFWSSRLLCLRMLTLNLEKFQVRFDCRIRYHSTGNVGMRSSFQLVGSLQWRYCRPHLDYHRRLAVHACSDCIYRGDGLDGSQQVSLLVPLTPENYMY
jgi:hypothetical protein